MPTIDIHTHMFGDGWLGMIKKHGAPASKPNGCIFN